jgi:hypothetical protein
VKGCAFIRRFWLSRRIECLAVACDRRGTALRPGFADQGCSHILRTPRSVLYLRVEAFRIRRLSLPCPHSQLSIRLAERNGAFELASRVENTNFT